MHLYFVLVTLMFIVARLYSNIVVYFTRYLEEFEKKIPRAEMLELQVFLCFHFYFFTVSF